MNELMNDTPFTNNLDNKDNLSTSNVFGDSDIVGTPRKAENEFYSQDIVGGPNWDVNLKGAPYTPASLNNETCEAAVKSDVPADFIDIPTLDNKLNTEAKVVDFGFSKPNNVVDFGTLVEKAEKTEPVEPVKPVEPNFPTAEPTTTVEPKITFSPTPVTVSKTPSTSDLQRVVQKLEKLEKMINPNSKKSLILWEEDNSFKNLISSIVSYANSCDTKNEFPIELLDRLKALGADVKQQIIDGDAKVVELNAQAVHNTELSQILSESYLACMAGTPVTELVNKLQDSEISPFIEQLTTLTTSLPDSEEYTNAERLIKSKITNLENSVHITIDLERTTSKAGALKYINEAVTPAIARLQSAYDEQYKPNYATDINGEDAVTALTVKKSLSERIYDTFVKPFTRLFKRKTKN